MSTLTALRQVGVLHRAGVIDLWRPWRGIAQSHAVRTFGPLAGAVRIGARTHPDRVALIDPTERLTYRDLDARTTALADAWRSAGIDDASRIGLLSRDDAGLVTAMIATAKLGARAVLLNTGFGAAQCAEVATREQLSAVYAQPEFGEVVAAFGLPVLNSAAPVGPIRGRVLRAPNSSGDFVILTGGTTGTPKGVTRRVSSPLAAAQFLDRVPLRSGDIILLCAPLFHGTSFSQLNIGFSIGATIVLHGRFDAGRALTELADHRCTAAVVVPTMLRRMLAVEGAPFDAITRHLRILFTAGEALPVDIGNRVVECFGPVVYNFYGSTETSTATIATPADWIAAPGTVGKPPIGIDIALVDRTGREGTAGSVYVRNPLAFGGYTDGRDKPRRGGYVDTGDLGHLDGAGRLFIDGRSDDMIVSGGENVFPGEVEEVIAAMPQVVEAAVIGVADQQFGQRLAAFVVAEGITEEDVRERVRAALARFKVPREVIFVDQLPRTATGKVLRRNLHRR